MAHRPSKGVGCCLAAVAWWALCGAPAAWAHIFVLENYRVGAYPPYPGSGWIGEAFLHIPDGEAAHLVTAESYIASTFDFDVDDDIDLDDFASFRDAITGE